MVGVIDDSGVSRSDGILPLLKSCRRNWAPPGLRRSVIPSMFSKIHPSACHPRSEPVVDRRRTETASPPHPHGICVCAATVIASGSRMLRRILLQFVRCGPASSPLLGWLSLRQIESRHPRHIFLSMVAPPEAWAENPDRQDSPDRKTPGRKGFRGEVNRFRPPLPAWPG